MKNDSKLLTDLELCEFLHISRQTLFNHLKHGPPDGCENGDIRTIKNHRVGKKRFWHLDSARKFVNQ